MPDDRHRHVRSFSVNLGLRPVLEGYLIPSAKRLMP
jgi:hypothetical protein